MKRPLTWPPHSLRSECCAIPGVGRGIDEVAEV